MLEAPLAGLRVLLTRDRAASERFAARLEQLGGVPVLCPAIETRFRNPPGLDEALAALDRFDWLLLTSANAVRAIGARLEHLGLDPASALSQIRVAVLGPATAAGLERLGARSDVVSSTGDADGLATDLQAIGIEGELILFPASSIARPELARRLREAGAGVIQLSVYETVAPEELSIPEPNEIDIAAFASPSAVRHVAGVVGPAWFRRVPLVCIGRTTAAAAREAGALEPVIAAEPSMAGIIATLLEFRQRRQQEVEHHGAG